MLCLRSGFAGRCTVGCRHPESPGLGNLGWGLATQQPKIHAMPLLEYGSVEGYGLHIAIQCHVARKQASKYTIHISWSWELDTRKQI
jgi:hypothetical protein